MIVFLWRTRYIQQTKKSDSYVKKCIRNNILFKILYWLLLQAGVCRFDPTTVIWSIDGEEKDKIILDNVKHIWIDMQRDIPPELLPVIGERSSVCRSAQPGQPGQPCSSKVLWSSDLRQIWGTLPYWLCNCARMLLAPLIW